MWSGTAADGNQNFREGNVRLDCAKFCRYPPDHKHSTKIGAGMSSLSIRKPGFRLLLGYPDIILTRDDAAEPVGSAAPGSDRFGADLRRLAAEVLRCGGRLTVVLPASEVWRGQVEPGGRAPRAEWRSARARAAASLGVAPEALRTIVGTAVGTRGRSRRRGAHQHPRRSAHAPRLGRAEAVRDRRRRRLRGVRSAPAALRPLGAAAGRPAPRAGRRRRPRRRRDRADGDGPPSRHPHGRPGSRRRGIRGRRDRTPVAPAPATTVAVVAPPAVKPAEPLRLVRADPPRARPAAPLVPAGAATQPVATLGTRNVPMVFVEDKGKPAAALRLAELTDPRGPLTDVAIPLRRPAATPAPLAAGALEPLPALRPGSRARAGRRRRPRRRRPPRGPSRQPPRRPPASRRCPAPGQSRCASPRSATR